VVAKNSALELECWTLRVFHILESEGCLVVLAVFKTAVVPLAGTR
jgi:hypothetical protein